MPVQASVMACGDDCGTGAEPTVNRAQLPSHTAMKKWQLTQNNQRYVFCDAEKNECYVRTPKTLLAKKTVAATVKPSETETVQASVFFAFNDAKLNQATIVGLTQNLLSLKEAKSVWLRGWTDPVGGKSSLKNKKLAEQRIAAVLDWLQNNGLQNVQIEKLMDPPCCNPDPLYPTDKERAQQRRVDIVLKRTVQE